MLDIVDRTMPGGGRMPQVGGMPNVGTMPKIDTVDVPYALPLSLLLRMWHCLLPFLSRES